MADVGNLAVGKPMCDQPPPRKGCALLKPHNPARRDAAGNVGMAERAPWTKTQVQEPAKLSFDWPGCMHTSRTRQFWWTCLSSGVQPE